MYGLSPVPPRAPAQLNIDAARPAYRVVEKRGFFDENDQLWEKGSMIYWEGPLNPGLEPINELAEANMREYLEHLDSEAHKVAEKKGSSYASLVNAFDAKRILNKMDKDNRRVDEEEMTPIMGGEKSRAKRAVAIGDPSPHEVPMMGARKSGRPRKVS